MNSTQVVNIFIELYPLVAALVAMITAQVLKVITNYISKGSIDYTRVKGAGGMPSSHSAMAASLTTAIGLSEGWTSAAFCIAAVFSLIVVYDAANLRREASKQAQTLNALIEDLFQTGEFKTDRLTELLGHTPLEVIAGICLGVGVAFTLFY